MSQNPAHDPSSSLRPAVRDPALPGDWIDRTQETYEPSPHRSRRIPPSGDVSRDGKRIYPEPSLASRILVWGGIVAGAAAATAGGVLAVRAVVDGIAGSDEDDAVEEARQRARARARKGNVPRLPKNAYARRSSEQRRASLAPRFAEMDEESREAMRQRDRERRDEDRERIERQRRAARARAKAQHHAESRPQHGLFDGVNHSITDVTRTVQNAVGTIAAAVEGFRSVAGQAGGIVTEFRDAAESVRSMLDTGAGPSRSRDSAPVSPATGRAHTSHRTAATGEEMVDLRDDPLTERTDEDRTHRL